MKLKTRHRLVALLLVGIFTLWIVCEKNPTESELPKEAPALPPASSMQLDLSLFENQSLEKSTLFSKLHFTNAALGLVFINAVVAFHMSVPVAVFVAAASQKPELQSDGKFHWIYSVNWEGKTFEADLAGWIDVAKKQVVWEMRISSNASILPLNKFLWYKGRSEIDASSGYWLFYDHTQPAKSVEVAQIDWSIAAADDRTLTFKGIQSGSETEGDTLEYHWQGDQRSVTLYDKSKDQTTLIHWNAETGAGCLQAPDYNEGQESCWDENQNDIEG